MLGVLNSGLLFPLLTVAAERLPGGVAATLAAARPLAAPRRTDLRVPS